MVPQKPSKAQLPTPSGFRERFNQRLYFFLEGHGSIPRQHPLPLGSVLSGAVSPKETNRRSRSRDPLSARMLQKPATEVRLFRCVIQSRKKYFVPRDLKN